MDRIKKIKKEIENMSKYHQVEVLRLCKKNNDILINENNNGTFINLTEVNEIVLQKLEDYVSYVIEQKKELDLIENKKNNLQNNFFNESLSINENFSNENLSINEGLNINENLDINENLSNEISNVINKKVISKKISNNNIINDDIISKEDC